MKLQVRISLLFVTTLLFSQTFTWAQISLPKVFGDSMVLQRGINIPVWGNSTPGALIIAKLGNRQVTAKANKEGKWQLKFPVFKAGGPYELQIVESGKPNSRISLKGILIGDVWVASGQSNMEWQVQQEKDASKEIATADFPNIRFLVVKQDKQLKPQPDIRGGKWEICDSSNVKEWSAVAYHFARKIHKDENIPIGIIQSTWGGTPVEAWTSRDMLLTSPITRSKTLSNDTLRFDQVNFLTDSLNWVHIWDIVYNPKNNADKIIPATEYSEADWTTVEMPNVIKDFGIGYYEGMVWLRKKVTLPDSLGQNDLTINLDTDKTLVINSGVEGPALITTSNDQDLHINPAVGGGQYLVLGANRWPTADGTSGQVLTTNGSGVLSFTTVSGTGTVTSVSVTSTNGFAGTVATATTTPAITLSTTVTGVLKGDGTAISAATSGTDYSAGTSSLATGILK